MVMASVPRVHAAAWRLTLRRWLGTLSFDVLLILHDALVKDDPALVQGLTTWPRSCDDPDAPCEGACFIGYAGWKEMQAILDRQEGCGRICVGDVEEYVSRSCGLIDILSGEEGACRYVINVWDDLPRQEARLKFLVEVDRELSHRYGAAA